MPFVTVNGKKILFVHIPRTGGTSTEQWLSQFGALRLFAYGIPPFLKCTPQHLCWSDISTLFGEDYFDYAFTVVRNPYRRLESEYKLRHVLARQGFFGGMESFPIWLETAIQQARHDPWHMDNHIRPQWHFASRHLKLFKFEEGLENIWTSVARDIGLEDVGSLPSPQLDTHAFEGEIAWDMKQVNLVREFYRQDFEQFEFDIFSYDAD